jgi:CheY-like chemotaxis protein
MVAINRAPLLLVEDSPEDREATLRAFRKCGFQHPIHACTGGDDALDYLNHRGKYAAPNAPPRPSLVLLDLNMPGTDGRQVLADIKQNPRLKTIPVIVLTTSTNGKDIASSFMAGASSYVIKPVDVDAFVKTIGMLKSWWFEESILPAAE